MRLMVALFFGSTSISLINAWPLVGMIRPQSSLIVVVLPAPLGPM